MTMKGNSQAHRQQPTAGSDLAHDDLCKKLYLHIESPSSGASRHLLPEEGLTCGGFAAFIKIAQSAFLNC
jgi:hypothetical protein